MSGRYLSIAQPIVKKDGTMEREFLDLTLEMIGEIRLKGTGSPEGVIEAAIHSEYIDTTGLSGSIKYIKMSSEIGGDRSKGWVLL